MKRAKPTIMEKLETKSYHYFYQCPHCKTFTHDYNITESVTRFKCSHCHQEIIANFETK